MSGTSFSLSSPMSFYRRNLPHWHPDGAALFLTWRLHGSLPLSFRVPAALPLERERAGKVFRDLDAMLDAAAAGPVWLKQPGVASLVVSTLRRGDRQLHLYELAAFVVMPNHVHVLLAPRATVPRITQWIKAIRLAKPTRHSVEAAQPSGSMNPTITGSATTRSINALCATSSSTPWQRGWLPVWSSCRGPAPMCRKLKHAPPA